MKVGGTGDVYNVYYLFFLLSILTLYPKEFSFLKECEGRRPMSR
ncbi:hypothetical protein P4U65_16930 [Bacillus pacificus]|nr:hypothetical protein [Bacillus thuringiensis]MED1302216.1 hypothetical protein [Bacillus pacificus]